MIVQCVRCETRFQLDASRVPATGVRVRCSRCKESFFLPHPSASESEVVHGIAEEAVSGASLSPGPSQDLVASTDVSDPPAGSAPVDADASPVSVGIREDEDWQFDDEIPEPETAREAPPVPQEVEAALDVEAPQVATALDADVNAEVAFGSVDDFSSLIEEVGAEGSPDYVIGDSVEGDLSAAPDPLAHAPAEEASTGGAAPTVAGAVDPELGDPEDWNFFSDASGSDYQAPPTATPTTQTSQETQQAGDDELASESGEATSYDAVELSAGGAESALARAGSAVGWVATISLIAFGFVQGFFLDPLRAHREAPSVAIGAFSADRLVPSWVENQYEGRILAIRGRLVNPTATSLRQEQTILVALLDAEGNAIASPPALAAMSLSEQAIRELPAAELRGAQARAAGALASVTLAAGDSLAFTALFHDVPEDAKAFALQTGPAWALVEESGAAPLGEQSAASSRLDPAS